MPTVGCRAVAVGLACIAAWSAVCSGDASLDPVANAPEAQATNALARFPRASTGSAARWLNLMSDYTRGGAADVTADGDEWFPRPIPINLPLGRGAGGKPVSVPVLILPVPVPAPAQSAGTEAAPATATQCATTGLKPQTQDEYSKDSDKSDNGHKNTPSPFQIKVASEGTRAGGSHEKQRPPVASTQRIPRSHQEPPTLDYVVSSQQLLELFLAQAAPEPELPPAVIPLSASEHTASVGAGDESAEPEPEVAGGARPVRVRRYQLPGASTPPPFSSVQREHRAEEPAPPRFTRSLMLRGELTVPRAGYTEPYTVWWDAVSGAARVDLHHGATSTYRTVMSDGRTRGIEMRTDRTGPGEVRRCATAAPRPTTAEDRALPALPDLQAFSYTGIVESEFGLVERWAHTVSGGAGELGGARGEALAFRHELLLKRAADNYTTTPLKYSVSVDSSTLGPACDGYVHRYTELRDQQHEPGLFVLDLVESCEEVAHTDARDRVEPLREFTMSHRDPRYDQQFDRYKAEFQRHYADDTEEAVRKNLMVQNLRFIGSGNRQGATFGLKLNYLGDRLDAELGVLSGVSDADARLAPGERFPHSRDAVAASRGRLPRAFDWRDKGAVTHVRHQRSCSSCWAFATVGAVEGALYIRTRALVPLSEQCLVDCAHPYGGHGCRGTWPSAAYRYVQERGLPALDEYTPYQAKVLQCVDGTVPPVTHISTHVNVTANNVQALKLAIRRHAPTVVIIDAMPKSFIHYEKGVFIDERCRKNKPLHAVLAVGWGVRGEEEHFILKNSWGAAWGEAGYVRMQARSNTCGVLSRPSYPRLEREDVDRLPSAAMPTAS